MLISRIAMIITFSICAGCATLSGDREQNYACAYDAVWDATLDVMQGQSVASSNKGTGLIETAWTDVAPLTERSFGIFSREGFGNRERARYECFRETNEGCGFCKCPGNQTAMACARRGNFASDQMVADGAFARCNE